MHLVDDKQYALGLAQRIRVCQKVVGKRSHAAFALYGFQYYRAYGVRQLALKVVEVVVFKAVKALRKRGIPLVLSGVAVTVSVAKVLP